MNGGATPRSRDDGRHRAPQARTTTRAPVPVSLAVAAAWSWRILLVSALGVAMVVLFNRLYLVVLPVLFALLLSALLHPLVALLRRVGLPRALATWGTVVVAFLAICGVGWFVVQQASANYQGTVGQVRSLVSQLRGYIDRVPGTNSDVLDQLQHQAVTTLQQHSQTVASSVLTVGTVAGEAVTGLIVMFFVTFFFLDEGDRIWSWVVRLFPRDVQPSVRGAGYRAWHVLSGWIVGTALIAVFHGVVIGLALALLGVPLAVPLAVLVFLGSFIPIVGALFFGGLTVLVALVTQGVVPAVIVLVVLIVENQVEAHLLQPFIVGRAVRLHPVAIVLALTGGGLIGGLFGAILAIPVVAALNAAWKYLTGVEDLDGNPARVDDDRMAPEPPPQYAPLPLYATPVVAEPHDAGSRDAESHDAGSHNAGPHDGAAGDEAGTDGSGSEGSGDARSTDEQD
ncbi:MAG TPA: AI-2E family transporter [Segeticoccus sp.]|nr:AI-2E family transporter [Segeticoccus sp.]